MNWRMPVWTERPVGDMSDNEFRKFIDKKKTINSRLDEIDAVGKTENNQNRSTQSGNSQNSQSNLSLATNGASNSGGFNWQSGTFGDLTKQAKDLAEFNLGLNQRQGEFDFNKRNQEFDANTGRQMRVNEQQNKWQSDLNRETQDAQTKRLGLQIEGQDRQQRTGIDQENFATDRAVRLASRRLGS